MYLAPILSEIYRDIFYIVSKRYLTAHILTVDAPSCAIRVRMTAPRYHCALEENYSRDICDEKDQKKKQETKKKIA